MKFQKGDIVKEIRGSKRTGKVIEAEIDADWATGEKYLITFGVVAGNIMCDGSDLELKKNKTSYPYHIRVFRR